MIYFLIPTYNEEANIPALAEELKGALPDQEKFFVFSDDCSTDQTIAVIKDHFEGTSFHVVTKEENRGPGHSFNLGFKWILENSGNESDKVVSMEADRTSDINLLPNMLTIANLGYDLVLASVYAQGGGFDKTSFFRKIISLVANMLFRGILNVKVLTLSSFYRVYDVSLLRRIKAQYPEIISEDGFICMMEILLKSIKLEATVIEVPMILKSDKRQGKSKMKVFKTGMSYLRFMMTNKIK